jgi:putative copper export protein
LISALTTFQQWLLFTATVLVVGCVAWRVRVVPGALRALRVAGSSGVAGAERRVASLGFAATGVLAVAWILRMVVQVMGFRDPFVPLWDDVSFLLFEIFWGTVWMGQGVVIALLAATLWLAGRGGKGHAASGADHAPGISVAWAAAALFVIALAGTLALSGHAMGVESGRALAVTADAVHTLAAGVWIGSLAVILTVGRESGAEDSTFFAAQIRSFSPMALVSAGALVAMGVLLAWKHLHAVSDLWSLQYGRILSAKLALVLLIFGLGFWNWRQGLPAADTPDGAAAVRRRAAWEVLLAVGVILLTAVLVHSPKP